MYIQESMPEKCKYKKSCLDNAHIKSEHDIFIYMNMPDTCSYKNHFLTHVYTKIIS